MSKELEKYIDERLAEYEKHWEENPLPPIPPVVDTGRKLFRRAMGAEIVPFSSVVPCTAA